MGRWIALHGDDRGRGMFFYREGNYSVGPFTREKMIELHEKRVIDDRTLVSQENSGVWYEFAKHPMLVMDSSPENITAALDPVTVMTVHDPAISPSQNVTTSGADCASGWCTAPVAPWRRFFARMLDVTVFGLIGWGFVGYLWYSFDPLAADSFFNHVHPIADSMMTVALGCLVSGVFLGFVGTTPGKSIFGIRVRDCNQNRLGVSRALARDFTVFAKGLGFGIPGVSFITMIVSYFMLRRHGEMSWDQGRYAVSYRKNGALQIVLSFSGLILYFIVILMIMVMNNAMDWISP